MCFVALLTCFRVRCLAGKLDWLMDVGFGVTHTHTRTHTHTHSNPHLDSPRALDMPAALGLTYDATWEICLCFPFLSHSPHNSSSCSAFICLFVCRVCLLISQLGVRLSDSPRMVNRRNSPARLYHQLSRVGSGSKMRAVSGEGGG